MEKNDTGTGGISETELVALLASLKVEPAPEADFEGRFLCDLRERLARESVCCPARRLLWDHVVQMLANFGPRKLAYGASTLGLGALAVGFFAFPGQPAASVAAAAKSPLSRLEHSMASLRPNSGRDAEACTTIRIGEQGKKPYTDLSLASGSFAVPFERAATVDTVPVNAGFGTRMLDSFPAYTTGIGF